MRVNHRGNWIFVQVETDDGIVGLGEASHSGDDAALTFLIRHSLRPKLIGRDPSSVEAIWRDLAQRAAGGLIDGRLDATALSGVEHALWDVNGQALGVPIHRLLGGALRERVRLYANINRHVTTARRAASRRRRRRPSRRGSRPSSSRRSTTSSGPSATAPSRARRWHAGSSGWLPCASAIGPDVELMVDCHERFNREMAVRVGRELAKLDVVWFEDPTEPTDDLQGLAGIRAELDLPLVTGERLFGRAAFWPLLTSGVVGTIMPDVKHCGGLWEGKKIAAMAEAARVMVSPHNPSGPIAALASAHLAATLPNFSRLEFAWGEVPWRGRADLARRADRQRRARRAPGAGLGRDAGAAPCLEEHGFDPGAA